MQREKRKDGYPHFFNHPKPLGSLRCKICWHLRSMAKTSLDLARWGTSSRWEGPRVKWHLLYTYYKQPLMRKTNSALVHTNITVKENQSCEKAGTAVGGWTDLSEGSLLAENLADSWGRPEKRERGRCSPISCSGCSQHCWALDYQISPHAYRSPLRWHGVIRLYEWVEMTWWNV